MWPLKIDQIKRLQLELTTFCNAKCPSCERAKYNVLPEFIYKKQLNSIEVSLEQIKKWIPLEKGDFKISNKKNILLLEKNPTI